MAYMDAFTGTYMAAGQQQHQHAMDLAEQHLREVLAQEQQREFDQRQSQEASQFGQRQSQEASQFGQDLDYRNRALGQSGDQFGQEMELRKQGLKQQGEASDANSLDNLMRLFSGLSPQNQTAAAMGLRQYLKTGAWPAGAPGSMPGGVPGDASAQGGQTAPADATHKPLLQTISKLSDALSQVVQGQQGQQSMSPAQSIMDPLGANIQGGMQQPQGQQPGTPGMPPVPGGMPGMQGPQQAQAGPVAGANPAQMAQAGQVAPQQPMQPQADMSSLDPVSASYAMMPDEDVQSGGMQGHGGQGIPGLQAPPGMTGDAWTSVPMKAQADFMRAQANMVKAQTYQQRAQLYSTELARLSGKDKWEQAFKTKQLEIQTKLKQGELALQSRGIDLQSRLGQQRIKMGWAQLEQGDRRLLVDLMDNVKGDSDDLFKQEKDADMVIAGLHQKLAEAQATSKTNIPVTLMTEDPGAYYRATESKNQAAAIVTTIQQQIDDMARQKEASSWTRNYLNQQVLKAAPGGFFGKDGQVDPKFTKDILNAKLTAPGARQQAAGSVPIPGVGGALRRLGGKKAK